jgi:glycosyltransferase involved in cell wall biosynthesis
MKKIVRITTVPQSLKILLKGQLNYISKYYIVIGISSSGKELQDVADEEGINVISLEMTRKITPIHDFISLIKLIFILRKLKPHYVHTHTPKAGLIGMLASWIICIPNRIHTVAGLPLMESKGFKRKLLIFVEKLTYKCSTQIYPNSRGLYDYIINNIYNNPIKLKVIANGSSNGIDLDYFKSEVVDTNIINDLYKKYNININSFIFIYIGRIVSDKGINELVKAFTNLPNNINNIKLILLGKFESDLDPLKYDTIFEIENNNNIIHIDFVNDVRPYLSISNCLVFPSYREGFPNVVMQAAAMNLPCIVSNINGCNEIIINEYNGIIVEKKNIDTLQNAMYRIHNDRNLYDILRKNSRPSIEKRFERNYFWEELLKEYKIIDKS